MTSAPEHIWLNDDGDYPAAVAAAYGTGLTWSEQKQYDGDTGYVRFDLYEQAVDLADKAGALMCKMDEDRLAVIAENDRLLKLVNDAAENDRLLKLVNDAVLKGMKP